MKEKAFQGLHLPQALRYITFGWLSLPLKEHKHYVVAHQYALIR